MEKLWQTCTFTARLWNLAGDNCTALPLKVLWKYMNHCLFSNCLDTLTSNGMEKNHEGIQFASEQRSSWKCSWKTNLGLQRGRIWPCIWCGAEKDKETHSKNKQAVLVPWFFWSWQSLSFNQAQIVQFHVEGTRWSLPSAYGNKIGGLSWLLGWARIQ